MFFAVFTPPFFRGFSRAPPPSAPPPASPPAASPMLQLCADLGAIIYGNLVNPLAPEDAINLGMTCTEQNKLFDEGARQRLKEAYRRAVVLCGHMGLTSVVELREAQSVIWLIRNGSCEYLEDFGSLGPVLPQLGALTLTPQAGASSCGLLEGLTEGLRGQVEPDEDQVLSGPRGCTLCALTSLTLTGVRVAERGALALACALDAGALPRLEQLDLGDTDIGDHDLEILAPSLRRRPALSSLTLADNSELSDDGILALVEPQPAEDEEVPPPPTGLLRQLRVLDLRRTAGTVDGGAFLEAALNKGLLPALETLKLIGVDGCAMAGPAPRQGGRVIDG